MPETGMQHLKKYIPVWDRTVRIFHWTVVVLFASAYLTGEKHQNEWHLLIGYTITPFIVWRLIWGFAGSHYARFKTFTFPATETIDYLKGMLRGHPPHYLGHNPAGALMMLALLTLLTALAVTGLALAGTLEFEGPLLALNAVMSDEQVYTLMDIHSVVAHIALILVVLHIIGAIVASIQHRENLVRAMVTGLKRNPSYRIDTASAPPGDSQQ